MPNYDADHFDPPAPVASVTLCDPATGAVMSNIHLLVDSGADVTLIPLEVAKQLGVGTVQGTIYELQGFDDSIQLAEAVILELVLLGKRFKGQFLLIDQPMGVLGRNILNSLSLLLDGLHSQWNEHTH